MFNWPCYLSEAGFKTFVLAIVVGATGFAVGAWVQSGGDGLIGIDGYYHIKMAALTLEKGVPVDFPYLSLTVLENDRFWDMHMLFHVFQAPFTLIDDLELAAKLATVFWFGVMLVTMYWVLARYRIPLPYLWILLLLAASEGFLYRLGMPRAQVFGVIYTFLAFHLLMERKNLSLSILTMLFVWTYKGFLILIPLTAFAVAAHYLETRKVEYRVVLAVTIGMAMGFVVNPYFPNDVLFIWDDVSEKIFSANYQTNVGGEWFPYDTREVLTQAGIALAVYLGSLVLLAPPRWRADKTQVFWALTATLWFFMLLRSKRFVEYFPPTAVMFLAFSGREYLEKLRRVVRFRSLTKETAAMAAVVCVLAVAAHANMQGVRDDLNEEKPADTYRGGARWLAENTPAGSRVFHTDWDDFPLLFFHNSHNTYIVGLDPDYMRVKHPELYELWSDISDGDVRDELATRLVETFGAEYVFSDNEHDSFLRTVHGDPSFEEVYSDSYTTVFHIVDRPDLDEFLENSHSQSKTGTAPVRKKITSEKPPWW